MKVMAEGPREMLLKEIGFIVAQRIEGKWRYACLAPNYWTWQTLDTKLRSVFPRAEIKSIQRNLEKREERFQKVIFDF